MPILGSVTLSVSKLCQHHELLNGTTGQTDLDVDAAKSLNTLTVWPMVTVGLWPAENSKTFGLTPVGVRFPLPAPFENLRVPDPQGWPADAP
jgi:hypothetical protein